MDKREKVIKGLECCEKKACIFKDTLKECPYWELCGEYEDAFEDCTTALSKDALALLKAQELRYTPREVRNVLMEYGQHDLSIGLGKVIKYDPVQVEDILTKARELTKPVIPHMVDWGIYECPKCKTRVDKTYKYCKHCGRPVKWE